MRLNQDIVDTNKRLEAEDASLEEVAKAEAALKQDPMDNDRVNQAAYTFQTSLPRIKALSSNMSRNALARVFKSVVEFPLAESYPKFRNQTETELFILTLSAISAKNVMSAAFMQGRESELKEEVTDNVVSEVLSEMQNKMEDKDNG